MPLSFPWASSPLRKKCTSQQGHHIPFGLQQRIRHAFLLRSSRHGLPSVPCCKSGESLRLAPGTTRFTGKPEIRAFLHRCSRLVGLVSYWLWYPDVSRNLACICPFLDTHTHKYTRYLEYWHPINNHTRWEFLFFLVFFGGVNLGLISNSISWVSEWMLQK